MRLKADQISRAVCDILSVLNKNQIDEIACRETRTRRWLLMHSREGATEVRPPKRARRNVKPLILEPLLLMNFVWRARSSI